MKFATTWRNQEKKIMLSEIRGRVTEWFHSYEGYKEIMVEN